MKDNAGVTLTCRKGCNHASSLRTLPLCLIILITIVLALVLGSSGTMDECEE